MTVLVYNSVSLPYPYTTRFSQEAVYDDQAKTDWCMTKFDIQVNAVLNINMLGMVAPQYAVTPPPASAAAIMARIRSDLLKPRRSLSFMCNGVQLIPQQTSGSGTVDVHNGPQPQSCVIVQLTNVTFLIQYHITAHYWENNLTVDGSLAATNRPGNNVLSNRWSETVEIDNCMYSKRSREGKFQIRSDNIDGVLADDLRSQMAVVGVPAGFVRESSSYTVTPDGLAIQYRVIDREVFKMPPKYAYEADGEYVGSTTRGGGKVYGDVTVRLRGCKDKAISPQDKLVDTAVFIAGSKLAIKGASILEHAEVRVGMWDNKVEVRMRAMMNASDTRDIMTGSLAAGAAGNGGVASLVNGKGFLDNICLTPLSEDGTPQPPYKDRGTASLFLQAAKYYDPSLRGTKLGNGDVAVNPSDNPLHGPGDPRSQLNRGVKVGEAGRNRED